MTVFSPRIGARGLFAVANARRPSRLESSPRSDDDDAIVSPVAVSRRPRYHAVARVGTPLVVVLLALAAGVALASIRKITRPEATAVATAISLRHSDLPTLKQESNPVTPQQERLNAQVTKCYGGVAPSEAYANTQSPTFMSSGKSSLTVSSSVEILPSAALVAKDFAATERPRALTCVLDQFESQLRAALPNGDKITSATAARILSVVHASAPTLDARFAITVSVHDGKTTVPVHVYTDAIGFTEGQAEVALDVQTTSVVPSASLERHLAGLLVTRARAAIG